MDVAASNFANPQRTERDTRYMGFNAWPRAFHKLSLWAVPSISSPSMTFCCTRPPALAARFFCTPPAPRDERRENEASIRLRPSHG